MRWSTSVLLAGLAVFASAGAANHQKSLPIPTSCPGVTFESSYKLSAAKGWKYTLLASGLSRPRALVFDTEGHLLVLESGKGLTAHTLGANGCISSSKTVIANTELNHGLALSPDGKTVYVSSMPTAWSYTYNAKTMTATNQKVVVKGMNPGGHPSRTLAVPPNKPNLLIVSLGSENNIDHEAVNKETGRAIVKVFDLSKTPAGGWTYNTQGWYLGYGLRNEIALVFDGNNMVWGIENSGDELVRTVDGVSTDVHNNNPAEELNYLGDPSISNENWYGYPTCWTVGPDGPASFIDKTFRVGQQFVIAPNSTFNDATCARRSTPPRLTIRAHSAPIDGKFDPSYKNLYASLHGSWNRVPATGYKVIQIPFKKVKGVGKGAKDRYDPVAAADDPAGYTDVLWTEDVENCNYATCLRPSGLVFHPDGSRIYVGSDGAVGEIYVLYKK